MQAPEEQAEDGLHPGGAQCTMGPEECGSAKPLQSGLCVCA